MEEPMSITTMMQYQWWLRRAALPAAAIGVLVLAGCSSSKSGGDTQSSATAGSASMTVTIRDASGHKGVLTNADGRTLYDSDQENGNVLCKSSACLAIWTPLTVSAGTTPTGPAQLAGKLTTMKRPDGKTQVALAGKPLYTFSFDHGAGQVGGDGQKDSFDGTHFTWHVAAATGSGGGAPAPAPSPSPSSSGGGYNY
jgi:predicted lipoprotein with Yx(FWY)xxD motif